MANTEELQRMLGYTRKKPAFLESGLDNSIEVAPSKIFNLSAGGADYVMMIRGIGYFVMSMTMTKINLAN